MTSFPVSHNTATEMSGELFISTKDVNSLCGSVKGLLRSDVLKHHPVDRLLRDWSFIVRNTGK